MATATNTTGPRIGEPVPGHGLRTVSDIVRLESWGPCGWRLEPIHLLDAAASGWSAPPEYRLTSPGTGLRLAVRVDATGRRLHLWGGQYWLRGRVEFCGDCEPSTFAPCWILCE